LVSIRACFYKTPTAARCAHSMLRQARRDVCRAGLLVFFVLSGSSSLW
jgi:hypothetical protein